MKALVALHGDIAGDREWLRGRAAAVDLIVAADGAASSLVEAGVAPHVVVGDMDSLAPELRITLERGGCFFEIHPTAKEQTDGELALLAAIARGATVIDVVGALGGARSDQAIANLLLLAHPKLGGAELTLVSARETVLLLRGPASREIHGARGDHVSLVPLDDHAGGVTTDGLRYSLLEGTLERGRTLGVSNELARESARVACRSGLLLVAHHRR